ncbi:MAG: hypothetical protein ACYTG1_04525 [Planctomycetota bacterium]
MSGNLLWWLLDLESIPAGAEGLRLTWERPWPAWLWALLVLLMGLFALWSYVRLGGRRSGRFVLAGARAALLLLVLVIVSGPMVELPRESVEPDWVVVLLDRSASMNIRDAGEAGARTTRQRELERLLDDHAGVFDGIADERRLLWLGFHVGAFDLAAAETDAGTADPATPGVAPARVFDLGEADGRRTRLSTALEQALQRTAARPVSGVVVVTDGRTDDPPTRAVMRRLQADAIPVFTVPLGSPKPLGDLAVRRVEAPRRAFVRDRVPVEVQIDRLGTAGAAVEGVVKLIDQLSGEELDRQELAAGDERDRITLTAEPGLAGAATWEVVIETTRPDLIPENNRRPVEIDLVDRPLRVLYVEGYPRWEYRYVKNLLVREKSIESSVMLVSADRDFAQEGNQPITRLPRSPEEFAQFDVIVIGDVPATFFSPEQLDMIRDHVAERGAGLLWIGGERWVPRTYAGTVLADLLAMRGSLNLPPVGRPVNMTPTPLAERLGVLRLVAGAESGWPNSLRDPSYGWSRLFYAQRIEPARLKPTAEVLAHTVDAVDGHPLPLVVHMRYGAGVALYVATDEVWRWRYGRGELLPEQFWVQLIRLLGRETLTTVGADAVLEVSPHRVAVNEPVRIEFQLLDAQIASVLPPTVRVLIEAADGRPPVEVDLSRLDEGDARYAVTYLPEATGEITVRVDDPALPGLDARSTVEVDAPDDELRRPETDHPLLASLSEATGGRLLSIGAVAPDDEAAPDEPAIVPAAVTELPGLLPNRSVRTINPLTERIWDTPLAFGLVLLLLAVEWIGRKLMSLV